MTGLITTENGNVEVDHYPGTVVLVVGNFQGRAQIALEPEEAAELAKILTEEAQNAIHAERIGRRRS
ncbi:hypothetical protein [Curtobacterium sp. MEB011]|uniref:hypothetical protein n=1 Tax=Curtobacterium sp. MEB011 TaxID=3040285 RepID=UPI00255161D0|nr:hypothetical protein [Curtobacterium sp. MEB011]